MSYDDVQGMSMGEQQNKKKTTFVELIAQWSSLCALRAAQ
jgi:hypothetical protein